MNPTRRIPIVEPVDVARAMHHEPGFVFLDSALSGEQSVSIIASNPDFVLRGRDWDALERELNKRRQDSGSADHPEGAAIGWIGYDGDFRFCFYNHIHVFEHETGNWRSFPKNFDESPSACPTAPIDFRPVLGCDEFLRMVAAAQEYIAAGDIYQVCLSHPFQAFGDANPWAFYEMLRKYSPAPYGAYLSDGDFQIASASPESFLRISGRKIQTSPIKGTRPRHPDKAGDQLSSLELLNSAKEIAELVMITDLERNDLGRVCRYGSVHVPELLRLESFEQVFHLVSTISGELRDDVSHVMALRECFPGGSISGAPKKRAMEIIHELEVHPRGLYTGAIGYFGYNGVSQFSIAIRTAVFEQGSSQFHVGAGIVADSIPEREWEETWHKAEGLLLAARACATSQP